MEINGKFGHIELGVHYDGDASHYEYEAKKITFNFKAEHVLTHEGSDTDTDSDWTPVGEMQVYHETADGEKAIVSFFIVDDRHAVPNGFFNTLNADFFEPEAGFSEVWETKPDINQIVMGGANMFFDKSFYMYSGSFTTPPCKEGLIHLVMKTPIRVASDQLVPLMKTNVDHTQIPNGNAREAQPLGNRHVYSYTDMHDCSLPEKTLYLIDRVKNKIDTKDSVATSHFVREEEDRSFVTYVPGLSHDPTFTSEDGKLRIEPIDSDEID
jgi:carbonic anhydrase